jgi:hypothetical protein
MRRLLAPLGDLALRLDVAVVIVQHLNKRVGEVGVSDNALYRLAGSLSGIAGLARSILIVAKDKIDDSGEIRCLAHVGGNLSKSPKALLFTLHGDDDSPATVLWLGEVDQNADELLRSSADGDELSRINEATTWLRDTLKEGPLTAREILTMARRDGIAERTLERAKSRLGILSQKEDGLPNGKWMWLLPSHVVQ